MPGACHRRSILRVPAQSLMFTSQPGHRLTSQQAKQVATSQVNQVTGSTFNQLDS